MKRLPYDVFLSYNGKDSDLARQIANELKACGLKVWFAESELRPGITWQDGLIKGINESNSTVILIGPSGINNWAAEEVRIALQGYVTDGYPLSPVILPGVENLDALNALSFLKQRTWVDCRDPHISQQSLDKLVWGITGRKPQRSISQFGDDFFLTLQRSTSVEKSIRVYTLPNPDMDRLLHLTWDSFGAGIENLRDQIDSTGFHLNVDACFGINDAGLVMATFLNYKVMDRVKLGYIRCKGTYEGAFISGEDSFFPKLPERPSLILMDFEVKTGKALDGIVQRIREEYTEPVIYFAAFGAMTSKDNLKIGCFDDLVSAELISGLGIRDIFFACTMHAPGIQPPFGLR